MSPKVPSGDINPVVCVVDWDGLEGVAGYVTELFEPVELLLQGAVFGHLGVVQFGGFVLVFVGVAHQHSDLDPVARPRPEDLVAFSAELVPRFHGIA